MTPMTIGSFSGILAAFRPHRDRLELPPGLLCPLHDRQRLLQDVVEDGGVELEHGHLIGGCVPSAISIGVDVAQVQCRPLTATLRTSTPCAGSAAASP